MASASIDRTTSAPAVVVCVCTYRRNAALRRLLERVVEIDDAADGRFQVGVVVVDDNSGREAEPVVDSFRTSFPLGIRYRHSGQQNISLARNLGLEAGATFGDLIAMTDDDCLPETTWIDELLAMHWATGADAVCGPLLNALPPEAPRWIASQEVYEHSHTPMEDGALMSLGQTNNCLLDVAWLQAHPEHRFDPEFGRIGGEDMVFFKGAVRLGMRSVHAANAIVRQLEPLDELRLPRMLHTFYWWGDSEAVTNIVCGEATRARMALRGLRLLARAVTMPFLRLVRRRPPHFRAAAVKGARAAGVIAGAFGIRVHHH